MHGHDTLGNTVRLLFITANRIGDAVLSSGVLGVLLDRHPGARVTIACGPAAAPLFEEVPGLERLIVLRKRRFSGHWRALWSQTVTTVWDLVVDLRASAFSWTVPARARLVFRPTREPVHRVVQLGRLLGLHPPPPRLWIGAHHRASAADLIPAGQPMLAVGPTANWGGKQWPAERFAAAIARLTGPGGLLPGARVAVFGGAGEVEAARPLLTALDPAKCVDLMGKVDLLTAAACLERCAFYLGNDSGLMHIAAATGIPTLGLFGPSDATFYAPWGERAGWVRSEQSFAEIVGAADYDHRSHQSRMQGLSVDAVVAAAERVWDRCLQPA